MPSLTIDTSPTHPQPPSQSPTEQAPPYSPITPTLSASLPHYTHTSQPLPIALPPLPPQEIDFSTNPDVLALKATISILQLQKRRAERDIRVLSEVKEKALRNPGAFAEALRDGRVGMRGDELMDPSGGDEESDEDDDVDVDGDVDMVEHEREILAHGHPVLAQERKNNMNGEREKWEPLPNLQTVARMPAVNWEQYGVVGESLDKMHRDQVARPGEGIPQRLRGDGLMERVGGVDGKRASGVVAVPYHPLRDRIEKGGKKGGKR